MKKVLFPILALALVLSMASAVNLTATPNSVTAAPDGTILEVVCVPWKAIENQPHPTWSGKEITLKGTVRFPGGADVTYEWDFGDGSPTETGSTWVGDDYLYPISTRHTYVGVPGSLFVATLTSTAGTESASDYYLIEILPLTREAEADVSIDEGLWWLYQQQFRYTDGAGVECGSWGDYARVAHTGAAVQAFENNLHKPFGDPSEDPYVDSVRRGLNFLLSMAFPVDISTEDPYGGDTNGNGFGIGCTDWERGGREMYEIGIAMMAIVSSDTPGRVAVTGPPGVIGRTYLDIMQDMADYCAWAQNDEVELTTTPGIWMYDLSTGVESLVMENWEISIEPGESISGDRIVWMDYRNGDYDIYMYDLSTGVETPICTDPAWQYYPAIDGDRIVWMDDRNGNGDIYMYDLSTGIETPLIIDPAHQSRPTIDGDRIVWMDVRNGNADIYMYDLSTGTETPICTNTSYQDYPAIDGDRIVWMDYRNDTFDIYIYDLTTGVEAPICTDPAWQYYPRIAGDRIVWMDDRNGDWDIYVYDLSTGVETPVCTAPGQQYYPAISGDVAVWMDYRNGKIDADVYAYDFSTGSEMPITTDPSNAYYPDISGDRIVWTVPPWDLPDPNRVGGWRYNPNFQDSDNSVTQWPIMGLDPAESKWGVEVADFVRPRLEQWLTYSQCREPEWTYGGFGYTSPCDWVNVGKTAGTGIPGLIFCEVPIDDERIQIALEFIDGQWFDDNFGNGYAMYAVKKAFAEFLPMETIGEHNWWEEYVDYIVPLQYPDGHWDTMAWAETDQLTTAWLILILTPGVYDIPPVADAKVNNTKHIEIDKGQCVTFDGSDSRRGTYEIVKYEWDFESDGIFDAIGEEVIYCYDEYGYNVVTLRVTDNRDVLTGGEKSAMTDLDICVVDVHPPPHEPIADANGPYEGWVGIPVVLDGSGSWDPNEPPFGEDQVVSWHWDLDNDGEFDDATGEIVEYTWYEPDIYPIALMVDAIGEPIWSKEPSRSVVEIGNHDPVADPNGPYVAGICVPLTLNGANSYDPDEPVGDYIVSYEWDLDNDGDYDDAAGSVVEAQFCDGGIHTVRLRVTDTYGATDSAWTTVTMIDIIAAIDIKPWSDPNSINLKNKGVVPVAILTTDVFDAAMIDPDTVLFAGAAPVHYAMEDVDNDGDIDMILQFNTQETDITPGDTEAALTGMTYDGRAFFGTDSVKTIPKGT